MHKESLNLTYDSVKINEVKEEVLKCQFIFKNLILVPTSPDYRLEITKGYHRKVLNCCVL